MFIDLLPLLCIHLCQFTAPQQVQHRPRCLRQRLAHIDTDIVGLGSVQGPQDVAAAAKHLRKMEVGYVKVSSFLAIG